MTDAARTTQFARRSLLVGAGTAVAGGLVAAGAGPALAAPVHPSGDGTSAAHAGPGKSSPITSTIASNPASGAVYRFVDMYDFKPFDTTAITTWGGQGVYTSNVVTPLRASMDVPPGSTIRDIEYYISNSSGGAVTCSSYVHVPGSGLIWNIGADLDIPAGDGTIVAGRIAPSLAGPYPFGARLLVSCTTRTDGTVEVNGARAGFVRAGAGTTLLAAPVRAYDSRATGGKFGVNETRTITISGGLVPPGTSGLIANLTATGSTAPGYLKVFARRNEPAADVVGELLRRPDRGQRGHRRGVGQPPDPGRGQCRGARHRRRGRHPGLTEPTGLFGPMTGDVGRPTTLRRVSEPPDVPGVPIGVGRRPAGDRGQRPGRPRLVGRRSRRLPRRARQLPRRRRFRLVPGTTARAGRAACSATSPDSGCWRSAAARPCARAGWPLAVAQWWPATCRPGCCVTRGPATAVPASKCRWCRPTPSACRSAPGPSTPSSPRSARSSSSPTPPPSCARRPGCCDRAGGSSSQPPTRCGGRSRTTRARTG